LSLFCLGFIDNSRGPVYPEILEYFNLTKSTGSLIFSLSSFMAFIGALTSKKWLGLLGAIRASKIALIFQIIACLIMGSVPSSELGYKLFLLGSMIFGLGVGIQSVSLNLIINDSTTDILRRRVYAGLHSMYGIASLIAPFFIGYNLSINFSWQDFFFYMAIIPGFVLVSFSLLKPNNLKDSSLGKITLSKVQLSYLCIIFAAYITGEVLVSSRLVIYLTEAKSLNGESAAQMLSLFFLFLLTGRLIFAAKSFKISSRKLLYISLISSITTMVGGILIYTPLWALSGLGMSYFFPCAMDWLSESLGAEMDQTFARVMTAAGAALVSIHVIFGTISEQIGIDLAIWIAPMLHLIVLYFLHFKTSFLAKSSNNC